MLRAAKSLRCLHLKLGDHRCRDYELDDIVQGYHWPKLRELELIMLSIRKRSLVDLIVGHADTLRRTSLHRIKLFGFHSERFSHDDDNENDDRDDGYNWRKISCEIPQLASLKLHEFLEDEDEDLEDEDRAECGIVKAHEEFIRFDTDVARKALANYIVHDSEPSGKEFFNNFQKHLEELRGCIPEVEDPYWTTWGWEKD